MVLYHSVITMTNAFLIQHISCVETVRHVDCYCFTVQIVSVNKDELSPPSSSLHHSFDVDSCPRKFTLLCLKCGTVSAGTACVTKVCLSV